MALIPQMTKPVFAPATRPDEHSAPSPAGDGVFFLVEAVRRSLPFYPYQQTFSASVSMSQTCHQLTLAAHQNNLGHDDLFSGNNEIVSIPRLTHRRHDSLVDGVDGYLTETSGRQKTFNFGFFVQMETVLENGTPNGTPRRKCAEHKTPIRSENAANFPEIGAGV